MGFVFPVKCTCVVMTVYMYMYMYVCNHEYINLISRVTPTCVVVRNPSAILLA